MSDELRDIVTALGSIDREDAHGCGVYASDEEVMSDLWVVFDAYRAEHPADDDEPITMGWMESLGFERYDKTYLVAGETCVIEITAFNDQWHVEIEHAPVCKCKTRGDVRRLLAALGITP